MPTRHVSRGALGAVVFAGAAAVAVLGLPVAGESVGVVAAARALTATASPGSGSDAGGPPGMPAFLPTSTATTTPSTEPQATVPTPEADAATPADREAGILRRTVAESASGEFDVAPGSVPAPGVGQTHMVRVEVERDLPVDPSRFASFVMTTLNDDRSWGHDGAMTFARTDGDAPITVVLASPETSARLCDDLDTRGRLSCRNGPHVVLTFYRWVNGTEEYADNLTGYRQYVVNHEVGHALGHGHERCPGPGEPAPVMQQQTLGLRGCAQNPWPHPGPHLEEPPPP